MRPILKYRGGKAREIPRILPHVPKDFNRYIEPFFGGGALFFYLEPEQALINDANSKLMAFYRQLRDDYPLMRKQMDELQRIYEVNQSEYRRLKEAHPNRRVPNANEELYYRLRQLYNYPDGSLLEGVLYFFINKTAYSGMIRHNSKGEYNVPFGRYASFNTQLITQRHSELLQRAELFNLDYREIFAMAKKDDFVFLDPPYDCVFNDYGNTGKSLVFDEAAQRRLAADFKALPCRALMIIGKTMLTEELYGQFAVEEYAKTYTVNIKNRFNANKVHMIVKNY